MALNSSAIRSGYGLNLSTWSTNSSLCSTTNFTAASLSSAALCKSARTRHSKQVSTVSESQSTSFIVIVRVFVQFRLHL